MVREFEPSAVITEPALDPLSLLCLLLPCSHALSLSLSKIVNKQTKITSNRTIITRYYEVSDVNVVSLSHTKYLVVMYCNHLLVMSEMIKCLPYKMTQGE